MSRPASKVLPVDAWPTDHRERWQAVLQPPQALPRAARYGRSVRLALEPDAAAKLDTGRRRRKSRRHPSAWSGAYAARIARGWGLWLGWLERSGQPLAPPSPELLVAFVDSLEGSNGTVSLATYVFEIWRACTLLWPEQDWAWLEADWRALKQLMAPRRDKRARFVPLEALLEFGLELMDEARSQPPSSEAAIVYRDGLFIALLAYRPKRARNIADLRLGTTALDDGNGEIRFSWPDSKNGDPVEATLPARLVPAWRHWLDTLRPCLPNAASDAVWLSQRGGAMAPGELATAMARRTRRKLGEALRPHMVRTLYATCVIAEEPGLRRAVSGQLDHRDSRSINAYALDAPTLGATRALDRQLAPLVAQRLEAGRKRRHRATSRPSPAP